MYRKYSNSSKCSRNERLAQLTEQESVIERKKQEILAKLEAKKKKETEEALKKLETTTMTTMTSAFKKETPHASAKSSWHRKDKDGEEEGVREVPRNAFSNDGSFLDQFKKLSKTGLGPQNMDISTLAKANKRDEELSCPKMEDEDRLRHSWEKGECDQQIHTEAPPRGNYNESILHHQLPPTQGPMPIHQYPVMDLLKPCIPGAAPAPVPPPAPVPQFTTNEIQLKAISSPPFTNTSTYQVPQHYQFPVTDTLGRDTPSHHSAAPPPPSVSAIEPPLPIKPQNIPPPMPMQVQNIPPPPPQEDYETNQKRRDLDDISDGCYLKEISEEGRRQSAVDSDTSPIHSSDACDSRRNVGKSRVSPALSDDEAGHSSESESSRSGNVRREEWAARAQNPKDRTQRDSRDSTAASPGPGNARRPSLSAESDNAVKKRRKSYSDDDSSDSDNVSGASTRWSRKSHQRPHESEKHKSSASRDGYQADCEDESSYSRGGEQRQRKMSFHKSSSEGSNSRTSEDIQDKARGGERTEPGEHPTPGDKPRRKKKSRWGDEVVPSPSNSGPGIGIQLPPTVVPLASTPAGKTPLLSKLTRSDPGLIQYAKQTFGSTNLSEEDWKKAEDHYKINLLYQDMVKKRAEIDSLEKAGKFKYEYDSDEDVEGGTWEHKLRQQEMMATQLWAEELTRQAAGKHHIGDFLPPEELERFMERYNAVKEGRKPDLSDYKEFKLKEDNVGYKLLQKMGWNEGQGLGQDGTGITNPVNKATTRHENQGLGVDRPDGLQAGDDEYDAYRKRMMLAYRFRPNPLNNPRRPYY